MAKKNWTPGEVSDVRNAAFGGGVYQGLLWAKNLTPVLEVLPPPTVKIKGNADYVALVVSQKGDTYSVFGVEIADFNELKDGFASVPEAALWAIDNCYPGLSPEEQNGE